MKLTRRRRLLLTLAAVPVLLIVGWFGVRELTAPHLNPVEKELVGVWYLVDSVEGKPEAIEFTRFGTLRKPGEVHLFEGADWRVPDDRPQLDFGNMRSGRAETWRVLLRRLRGHEPEWVTVGMMLERGDRCFRLGTVGVAMWLFRDAADAAAFVEAGRPYDFRRVKLVSP